MRDGYKMTELGEIPEDWALVSLGEIGDFKNGINKSKEDFGHGVPFVNLMNVFGNNIISGENLSLVNATTKEIKDYELLTGDVLFIRSSVKPSGVGLTAVIPFDFTNTVYSGFLIRFRDVGQLETQFKRYCFYEDGFRNRLINQSSVSANTNINQGALEKLQIPLPPLAEQQKIATILSTVDEKIEVIDSKITQTRELKKGLMQKLLTRGIGHTRFKDSVLGEIPESWEVKKLSQIAKISSGTTPFRQLHDDYYLNGTIPWVKTLDLNNSLIHYTQECITSKAFSDTSLRLYPKGTILVAMYGGYNQIGRTGLLDVEATINQALSAIQLFPDQDSGFILATLNHRVDDWKSFAASSRKDPNITGKDVNDFPVAVPSLSEQAKISSVIFEIDKKLEVLISKKETYQHLKKGLMQQLLTGKVRVVQSVLENA
jgi:type I restriction enzyme S subunit